LEWCTRVLRVFLPTSAPRAGCLLSRWPATILALLAAGPLAAQTAEESEGIGSVVPHGLVLTPSVSVLGFFDDNVFITRVGPQESAGARLIGGLSATLPREHVTYTASYSFTSDWFDRFRDISDVLAAQSASVGLGWQAGRHTSVSLAGRYGQSNTPTDVLPETGLDFGRRAAETYSGGIQVSRDVGQRGRVGIGYTYSVLVYPLVASLEQRHSESWSASWSQEIGRHTSLSLSGGASNIESTFSPTYGASLSHSWRRSSLSLSYSRGTYTTPTIGGSSESESLGLGYSLRAGRLSLGLGPRVSQNADALRLVRTFSLGAQASLALGRWFSLQASYQGSRQRIDESLAAGDVRSRDLEHQVVYFGLSFSRPIHLH
jgi:hypothetical protein